MQLIETADTFPDVSGRTPVLAVGSNQSPQQLARKFRGDHWGVIPTARVHLLGFDTVYSAHVTGYGSIAATLYPSAGTRVALYVNWLTDAQLAAMHKTELASENYTYEQLENVQISVEAGPALTTVNFYKGQRGAYAPRGDVIPMAEAPAENRKFKAMSQSEVLGVVHNQVADHVAFERFVHVAVENAEKRQEYIRVLGKTSRKVSTDS